MLCDLYMTSSHEDLLKWIEIGSLVSLTPHRSNIYFIQFVNKVSENIVNCGRTQIKL